MTAKKSKTEKKDKKATKEEPKKKATKKEAEFEKDSILKSKVFTPIEKDFLGAYLEDDKKYTVNDARNLLNKKLKGAVK